MTNERTTEVLPGTDQRNNPPSPSAAGNAGKDVAKPKRKGAEQAIVMAPQSVTPMELIQVAMNQNADVGKLEALMNLQLRWEANEAKKAFVAAMNAFKADPPEILKNHAVAYDTKAGNKVAYSHATLDHVCNAVTSALSTHDISHRWKIETRENKLIRVTCVLTHSMGHSEDTYLEGMPDDSGGKNSIQAVGSTVTYLERYSLLAACGLAAKNGDNDGRGAPPWEKLQEFLDAISTAPNLNVLERDFKAGFTEAAKLINTEAMKLLVAAKDERKKILQSGDTGAA